MPMLKNDSHKNLIVGSIVCAVGALFYCYEFILRIIPGALPTELSVAFGNISATTFGQLSALYYFAYSPMQLPVGMLMDRYGPRKLLTFACLCCAIGSWLFTITTSLFIAGCGRFLVGFGSSFAFVGVLYLAVQWLPRHLFSLVAGLMTTVGMLGITYGEIEITRIALTSGWQYVLFILVGIGFLLTILIFCVIRDNQEVKQYYPWHDFFTNVWKVLTSSQVWLVGFVGACLYTSLSVFGELWGKNYLEYAHYLTKTEAAHCVSAVFLGWAIGAPLVGYLSDRTGKRVLPLSIGAIMACICISVVLYYPGLSYYWLFFLLFFYGVFSSIEIIVFIMGKENSGAELSGTVFAVVNMIVTLGGVFLQPLVGKLLDLVGDKLPSGEYIYTAGDYQFALSVLPIFLFLIVICTFFMREDKKKL